MKVSTTTIIENYPTVENVERLLKNASSHALDLASFTHTWPEAEARFDAGDMFDNCVLLVRKEHTC